MLSSLEEHDFLFQLQMSDMSQDDSEVRGTELQSLHGHQWPLTMSHEIVPQKTNTMPATVHIDMEVLQGTNADQCSLSFQCGVITLHALKCSIIGVLCIIVVHK